MKNNKRKKQSPKLPPNTIIRNGKWYVRVRYTGSDGKMHAIEELCEPETDTQALLTRDEILAVIERKKRGLSDKAPPLMFSELCTRWADIELQEPVYHNNTKVAGRKAVANVKNHMEVIRSYFGHRDFRTLSYGDLQIFQRYLLTTPYTVNLTDVKKNRAIATVNRYMQTFRQILLFAVREGWLHQTPFKMGKPLISLTDEKPRTQVLTKNDEQVLIQYCCAERSYMRPVVIACLYGGMRPGEIFSAKWSQVDFARREFTLHSWLTKTGKTRIIPMNDILYDALIQWKAHKLAKNKYGDDELIIGIQTWKRAWKYLQEKIKREDLQLRDLRATCGTKLANSGANIKLVADFLGHQTVKMAERHYIRTSTDDLRNAITKASGE